MALSGSAYKAFARHRLVLEWSATQNVSGNYSDVTTNIYLQSMDVYGAMNAPASNAGKVSINGTNQSFTATSSLSANQKKLLTTKTQRVNHNADGTKSFSISATFNINVTFAGVFYGNQTASGTWSLNTIPRKSGVSLSKSTANFGESITIKISRAASGFTHTLRYLFGNKSGTIASKTSATSQAWTLPNDLMNVIPSNTTGVGSIYCDTYNGSTKIGETSVKFTGNVPSNIVPSYSSLGITETETSVITVLGQQSNATGTYLAGLSRIKFTISGESTSYGATIASRKITFNGQSWNAGTATTGSINKTGALVVTASITDTRGRTASKSATINITAYSAPKYSLISVTRTADGMGTSLSVVREGTFSQVLSKNIITLTMDYRESSATTWINYSGFTASSTPPAASFGATIVTNATAVFDITKTYVVRITARDKFGQSATWENVVGTALVALSLSKNGIGVGKIWEGGALDVDGDMNINGDINMTKSARLNISRDKYASEGGAVNFNNSDVVGMNGIYFGGLGSKDPSDNDGEGLLFPKSSTDIPATGKIDRNTGWDSFRIVDGIGYLNGKPVIMDTSKILWSGQAYPVANSNITPSVKLSDCPNGWILVWSDYDADVGKSNDFDWYYSVIHKTFNSGGGIRIHVPNTDNDYGNKYIYCTGTAINGHTVNSATGGSKDVVLRQVVAF